MSQETLNWLNYNVLVGFTEKRGKAWHYKASEQGTEPNHYPGAIPVPDVIRRLFSWEPVSLPVYVAVPASIEDAQSIDAEGRPIKFVLQGDRQAIAASDNHDVLGLFKGGYQSHSYAEWLVGNVQNLLQHQIGIGSAGLLKNRAQAWVQVEIPETLSTRHGVAFRPNLTAYTSLDGSLATNYKPTVGIVVCDNTLSAALAEATQSFRVKHTKHSSLRLNDAQKALGLLESVAGDFEAELDKLIAWTITDRQFDDLLTKLCAPTSETKRSKSLADKKRSEVTSLYRHDERASTWRGTAFGVLQAFNTYETHVATVRNVERVERNLSDVLSGKSFAKDEEVLRVLATV